MVSASVSMPVQRAWPRRCGFERPANGYYKGLPCRVQIGVRGLEPC